MKKIQHPIPLHPLFIAIYPIVFLLSYNISQINPTQALRPIVISVAVAFFLTFLFGAAAKNYGQGGLSASILLALFFTYGHVHRWLEANLSNFANHALLLILWLFLLVIGMLLKYKIRDVEITTKYLNIISFVLILQPIFSIVFFIAQSGVPEEIKPPSPFENIQPSLSEVNFDTPDIYYIILDAYGRADVIEELFSYDNVDFIHYLEERGFYIAEQSRSNYVQTSLSLASSLNLNYLGEAEDVESGDRDPLAELIQHSEVRSYLEGQGYQTVAFATGYGPSTLADADIFISYHPNLINDLEGLILRTSVTRAMGDKMQNLFLPFLCDTQRDGILNIFENLKNVPDLPGPKFVFAHILSPHPPFIFDADGNAVKHGDCNGLDGTSFEGSRDDYEEGYSQQIAYISKLTKDVIESILANSTTPPVIIIQGDHGSGMLLDLNSSENSCLHERTANLNAYYIPSAKDNLLYKEISPVNSFRVVFNEVFDLELPLLDDRIYYSTWDKPYQLEDITHKIETSCQMEK